tara:strand:- start:94 stop:816 length:723 start_codon:yes stop_codon:yes gene_type:complete
MSIGNLKTDGGKGTNWPWQYKMLLGLDKIVATIKTDGKDYESDLVSITCAGPVPPAGTVLRLEVRVFDTTTGAFTSISYYEPGSIVADPADYSACTITYLEAGDATEATLQAILTKNTEIETTADAILAMNTDIEAKTTLVVANTDDIKGFNETIRDNTDAVVVTPALIDTIVSGTVAAGARSVSIANVGTEIGTVLGTNIAVGATVTFDAGSLNNTLSVLAYDPTTPGTGTRFLIATLT